MKQFARLVRFILYVLVFTSVFAIEITVHAAEDVRLPAVSASEITQVPQGCLETAGAACALATFERQKFLLTLEGESRLWLDQNSSVVRLPKSSPSKNETEIRLVKGQIWVEAQTPVRVTSEQGSFIATQGEFWVRRDGDHLVGSSVAGDLRLEARGAKDALLVPVGLENWIGRVGTHGEATSGVPTPIRFGEHLLRWARLFPGKKKEFTEKVEAFHTVWVVSSHLSADISRDLFERKVASVEEADHKKRAQVAERKKYNDSVNALFRKKVLSGE